MIWLYACIMSCCEGLKGKLLSPNNLMCTRRPSFDHILVRMFYSYLFYLVRLPLRSKSIFFLFIHFNLYCEVSNGIEFSSNKLTRSRRPSFEYNLLIRFLLFKPILSCYTPIMFQVDFLFHFFSY